MNLTPLPIDAVLPELLAALRRQSAVVLQAPAGAGKTTRVPPAILDAGLAGSGRIVLLQPRRLAARAAAARIAAERAGRLGDEVGFQVRFERQASRDTRILAVTDGVFVRMLADDPFLEGVSLVVFDEFHERSINSDLALAMARRIQVDLRPELKLVVMSATLAAEPIAGWLGGCPIVRSEGRTFPVEVRYSPHSPHGPIAPHVARGIESVLDQTGDVLAFLPGVGEIRQVERELAAGGRVGEAEVMPLYADLPLAEQQAVLEPGKRRKIVLATNVAETSLTIEGVTAVVDSGLARVLKLDAALGLDRLETTRISRASADQRAGRAGRTAPGVCLRLWSEREQGGLRDFESPEIARVDLAGPVLELLTWGETDVARFGWYEPPPAAAVEQALRLLRRLGALGDRGVTPMGRRMARLPVHPRLARALIEGHSCGHADRVATACALLSERDPFRASRQEESRHTSDSDVLDRVAALEAFERTGQRHSEVGAVEGGTAKAILRARKQLLRLLSGEQAEKRFEHISADEAVLRSLFVAFADRLARRREPRSPRAVMLGGRGVRLARSSAVRDAPLFACVNLSETGKAESLVHLASAVERDWLPEEDLQVAVEVEFDPRRERVVAIRRTRLEDLVLDEAMTSLPSGFDPAPLLAAAASESLERTLSLDEEATTFINRIRFLRQAMPELELPDLGDDPLRPLLPWLSIGRQSFEELRRAPVLPALKAMLTPAQVAGLEREAPQRLRVPSGRELALRYESAQPPILEVKIQEMFGLPETPRVAAGRVPVILHLLAPNMRPQQVTSDLASFWKNAYPVVRKELRRRYSKHPWPEDPLSASPKR